jgi:hypothetical protein
MQGFVTSLPGGRILAGIVAPPDAVPGPLDLVAGTVHTRNDVGGTVLQACDLGLNAIASTSGAFDGTPMTAEQLARARAQFVSCAATAVRGAADAANGILPPMTDPDTIGVMPKTEESTRPPQGSATHYLQPESAVPISNSIVRRGQLATGQRPTECRLGVGW